MMALRPYLLLRRPSLDPPRNDLLIVFVSMLCYMFLAVFVGCSVGLRVCVLAAGTNRIRVRLFCVGSICWGPIIQKGRDAAHLILKGIGARSGHFGPQD